MTDKFTVLKTYAPEKSFQIELSFGDEAFNDTSTLPSEITAYLFDVANVITSMLATHNESTTDIVTNNNAIIPNNIQVSNRNPETGHIVTLTLDSNKFPFDVENLPLEIVNMMQDTTSAIKKLLESYFEEEPLVVTEVVNEIPTETPIDVPVTRALASIRTVDEIIPITVIETGEEANSICYMRTGGWWLVTKKDEFKVGDLCVYFEIDSILPETEWSEFMRQRKFKVKTMKLNKMSAKRSADGEAGFVISQGLALPVSILPENTSVAEGLDVTTLLGVTKYEPPETFKQGNNAGNFPDDVPKTDELRVQSYPKLLEELDGKPYYITIKCDGTSCTAVYRDDERAFQVASRNFLKTRDENDTYWKTVLAIGLEEKLKTKPNFVVQGEVCGEGIQKNLLGIKGTKFFAFNVYDIANAKYLPYTEFVTFCQELDIPTVPIFETGDSFGYTMSQLEQLTYRNYEGTNNQIEGLVVRSQEGLKSKVIFKMLSFKYINPLYAEKHG